ncbi:MAG TPA: polyprenyl diphosphate synthase [Candidatus Saccharimonadales bacterium]|nr:polyprenyl diphosphate synthase [Candidatus Saccharimonadales bacterium]
MSINQNPNQNPDQSPNQNPDAAELPRHVGIILDGNRRWAKSRGLPQLEGHRRGYDNLKTIGEAALERGVSYLSAYVFSTENWQRSKEEVNYLMDLLYWVATHEVAEMNRKNIRVRFLGSKHRLSSKILQAIDQAEAKTAANSKGTVAFCLNYGGQVEITEAVGKMLADAVPAEDATIEKIASYLYAPDIPPLDLVIRTSGEQRLSNFMLWRAAYAELYFTDKHWPDFSPADLDAALAEYALRKRRFGGDDGDRSGSRPQATGLAR